MVVVVVVCVHVVVSHIYMKRCKTYLTYREYNKFQDNGFGWVTKAKSREYKLGVDTTAT